MRGWDFRCVARFVVLRYATTKTINYASAPYAGVKHMKPPIIFEVYDVFPEEILAGRITGPNIHVGDLFTAVRLRKTVRKLGDEYQYEYEDLFENGKIEILSISAYRKEVEWLHAPYGAGIKISQEYIDILDKHIKGIEPELGIVELIGPYSEKSDITGNGRWA